MSVQTHLHVSSKQSEDISNTYSYKKRGGGSRRPSSTKLTTPRFVSARTSHTTYIFIYIHIHTHTHIACTYYIDNIYTYIYPRV